MTLTPAYDKQEIDKRKREVELCGKNMGKHDYIPIQWNQAENVKSVTRLLCRVCFVNVSVKMLIENYPEVKL